MKKYLLYDKGKRFDNGAEEATVSTGGFALDEAGLTWYADETPEAPVVFTQE